VAFLNTLTMAVAVV